MSLIGNLQRNLFLMLITSQWKLTLISEAMILTYTFNILQSLCEGMFLNSQFSMFMSQHRKPDYGGKYWVHTPHMQPQWGRLDKIQAKTIKEIKYTTITPTLSYTICCILLGKFVKTPKGFGFYNQSCELLFSLRVRQH